MLTKVSLLNDMRRKLDKRELKQLRNKFVLINEKITHKNLNNDVTVVSYLRENKNKIKTVRKKRHM